MSVWDTLDLDRPGPKYLAIRDALAEAIRGGRLSPGRKLPSHRMLARKLGVSVGTVTRAYEEALERGLLTGEVGRGTFVSHHPPAPLRVVDSSRIPSDCLDLYQNIPVAIPEVENKAWADALTALRRDHDLAAISRRSWSETSARHQQAGVAWIARTGLAASAAHILDCPGLMAALCAILGATTKPGDLVVTASLSHPVVRLLAEQYQLKIAGLLLDEHGIVPDAFEAACHDDPPRLIYLAPTIHPPTTATMPDQRRRAVAEIANRHDVLIVEDESAAFLLSEPALPVSAHAPRRSFFIGDVWMALSMGLRTSYVLVPESLHVVMAKAVAATSGLTPPLMAEIANEWIESGVADRLIERRRAELIERNAIAREVLGRRKLHSDPCGHHVWLELPRPWRSDVFVLRAEQLGVAVGGAEWFAVGHGSIPEAVRICIGNAPGRDELRRALGLIDRLIDEPRSSTRPAV
jgi:DNA-binding transcriptional MocR family regulator